MSENGKLVAVENQYFFMQTKSGFPWYAKTRYSALYYMPYRKAITAFH